MVFSKKWMTKSNIENTLRCYRSKELKTVKQVAKELKTTPHTVQEILNRSMSRKERKALAMLRYSAAKSGSRSPMWGKFEEKHPNWKGTCDDHKGYLTIKRNGRRIFVHHETMLPLLGLKRLPRRLEVHHIDQDRHNNHPDNLAIVTRGGHSALHAIMRYRETKQWRSRKSKLAEAMKYST